MTSLVGGLDATRAVPPFAPVIGTPIPWLEPNFARFDGRLTAARASPIVAAAPPHGLLVEER